MPAAESAVLFPTPVYSSPFCFTIFGLYFQPLSAVVLILKMAESHYEEKGNIQ